MMGTIFVLVVMIMIVKLWPARTSVEESSDERIVFQDNVLIEHIEITRQESAPPSPPRPQPPLPVPNDVIIEDPLELDVSLDLTEFATLDESLGVGQSGDEPVIVRSPQLPPTVVKIVEPHVPDIPGSIRGRIELIVSFLVNETGGVEEVSIVEIRLYNDNFSEYEILERIEYGIMSATLEAAFEWQFRPARHEGSGVWTYTTHRFNY